jgi:hypothetical protein
LSLVFLFQSSTATWPTPHSSTTFNFFVFEYFHLYLVL